MSRSPREPRGWWASGTPLLLLLAAIAVFQLATIRSGHVWGDDHALYMLHARALLEGRGYADTGFIYNPENPWYSTAVYPPGFPLLLLPVIAGFGLNLFAMKTLVVAFLVGTAAVLALLVRRDLPGPYSLVPVALLGFQPYLTDFKDNVLPDIPFVFFILLNLVLLHRLDERRPHGRAGVLLGLLAGVLLWYTIAVRTIGITLFGAIALGLLLRRRMPGIALLVCVAAAALLVAAQRELMPAASGYATQVATAVSQRGIALYLPEPGKIQLLAGETFLLWQGPPTLVRNGIGVLVLLLGAAGFAGRLRRPTIVEALVIAYGAAIFIFPVHELRYSLPLVPLLFFYATLAFRWLILAFPRTGLVGACALGLVLAGTYGVRLARADYGSITDGSVGPRAIDLYRAVRSCTDPDARVLFGRARALTLYTRRPTMPLPRPRVDLRSFLDAQAVDYAIATRGDRLDRLARDPAARLQQVYANSEFILYRHLPAGGTRIDSPAPRCRAR